MATYIFIIKHKVPIYLAAKDLFERKPFPGGKGYLSAIKNHFAAWTFNELLISMDVKAKDLPHGHLKDVASAGFQRA